MVGMRRDLKNKLDALERKERLRRLSITLVLGFLIAGAAFLYSRPDTQTGNVSATVERSVVGVDHWGQEFHQLRVRLDNNRVVPVDTFLVKHPLKTGQRVTLARYKGFWGNVFYRLAPRSKTPRG